MDASTLGIAHFWSRADAVIQLTTYVLLAMSVGTWFLILWKSWAWWRMRRAARVVERFWNARSLDDATVVLQKVDREAIFAPLALAARQAAAPAPASLDAQTEATERLRRSLRGALHRSLARLDFGQTFLASVASTAPFVGLFGTVWGIYHALIGIASLRSVSIDRVAGPVGEALIMTAFGLAVAIPAVLAFNAFARSTRSVTAQLDAFAHDLHAFGTRAPTAPRATPPTA